MKKLLGLLTVLMMIGAIFAAPVHLVIFHINDTHGHAWSYSEYHNPDIGGFARIATIVNEQRAEIEKEGGHVLFLHAGDANTGIPESDQLNAVPDFAMLHYMGVDAMALGNHEFDKDLQTLEMQQRVAHFPFLSSNFVDKNLLPIFKPYLIKDFGDLKVGIIGVTTEQTNVLEPLHLGTNRIESAEEAVKDYLPEIKAKSDIIVVLGHLGYGVRPNLPVGYTTSDELAKKVDGISVIIDGHSHTVIEPPKDINNTIVAQAGEWGKYVGRIDLWIDKGRVTKWEGKLIPVNLKKYKGKDENGKAIYENLNPVKEDPFIKMIADSYYNMGAEKLNEVIGETKINLDGERQDVRSKETNLAHLITDATLEKTNADFAFTNGGGIRASIKPGKITYRDILTVLPFGNTVYIVKLTGKDVMDVLNYAVTIPAGQGAHMHVSGITYDVVNGKPTNVKIKGEPLDMNKVYNAVTNNYVAAGGDGYKMLKGKNGYDTGFVLADVVKDYIKELGTIENYDSKNRINVK